MNAVSRRILKDHYQGELEEDEAAENSLDNEELMSENSFESEDYAEPVTPIPPRHVAAQDDASNYDQVNNYRTTERPFGDQQVKRGGFIGNFYQTINFSLMGMPGFFYCTGRVTCIDYRSSSFSFQPVS